MASFSRRSELLLPQRAATTPPTHPQQQPIQDPYAAFGTPRPVNPPQQIPTIRLTTATPAQSSVSSSPLAPRQEPRAKLVPKRSKLSMLVSKQKDKDKDMSDVLRRVGANADSTRSFDIYVDPADDPEIGEIVVVQRKKSRAALGDLGWSLNIEAARQQAAALKEKETKEKVKETKENKENEKEGNWFTRTMGRGRKDSKEKDAEKQRGRSKSPGPFRSLSGVIAPKPALPPSNLGRPANPRTHSLDTGLLLSIPAAASTAGMPIILTPPADQTHFPDPFAANPVFHSDVPPPTRPTTPTFGLGISSEPAPPQSQPGRGRSATLSFGSAALLAPPPNAAAPADKNGSLAIRAMRSVKSLARLSSWAQLRGGDDKENPWQEDKPVSEKKAKKDKEKAGQKKEKRASKTGTVSSKTGTVTSAALSELNNRLSVDSARDQPTLRGKKQSIGAESILSSASGGSADPRRISTGSSVRWDPSVVDTAARERERTERRASSSTASTKRSSKRDSGEKERGSSSKKDSKRDAADARKRPALPVWMMGSDEPSRPPMTSTFPLDPPPPPPTPPVLTPAQDEFHRAIMYAKSFTESPTSELPNWSLEPQMGTPPVPELSETPAKRVRPRPMSEQLLGQRQLPAMIDDDPLAALNAATSDLASLIGRLDLQTPDSTPHTTRTRFDADDLTEPLPSMRGSPVRRAATMGLSSIVMPTPDTPKSGAQPQPEPTSPQTARGHQVSLTSLRPYAQCRTPTKRNSGVATTMTVHTSVKPLIGQPIVAPMPMSPSQLKKDALSKREALPKLRSVGSLSKTSAGLASPSTPTESQNTLRGTLKRRSTQMLAAIFSTPEIPPRSETPPPPVQSLPPPPPPAVNKRPGAAAAAISPRASTLRPTRLLSRKDDPASSTTATTPASPASSKLKPKAAAAHVNNVSTTLKTAKTVSPRTVTKDGTITTTKNDKKTPSPPAKGAAAPSPASLKDNTSPTPSASPAIPPGSTFGQSRPPTKTLRTPAAAPDTPTPPSTRACGHVRKSSSLVAIAPQSTKGHARKQSGQITKDLRRNLGMKGTLGMGSTADPEAAADVPLEEGDSDVPDELQSIISSAENTVAFPTPERDAARDILSRPLTMRPTPPSPGPPPPMPPPTPVPTPAGTLSLPLPRRISIPVFQAFVSNEGNEPAVTSPSDSTEDTKKSFDFTGELASLSQAAPGDGSFVEQLEAAFQTPSKMGLNFNLSLAPPVPPLPAGLRHRKSNVSSVGDGPLSNPAFDEAEERVLEVDDTTKTDPFGGSSDGGDEDGEDDCVQIKPMSRPSDGQLNRSFKFGSSTSSKPPSPGASPALSAQDSGNRGLTLSDIIPPPEVAERIRTESTASMDQSVMHALASQPQPLPHSFEQATRQVRERLSSIAESDSASKRKARQDAYQTLVRGRHGHSPSEVSFSGLSTFGDIRNKWEYGMSAQRSAAPPPTSRRRPHARQISEISIASVSDYGVVLQGGKPDPFNFGPTNMMSVDDLSSTMEDTFDFRRAHVRNRSVDSDRSSFYFRSAPIWRGHHRRNTSVWSNADVSGPPPSTFQRFGHKHNDSTASASSVAMAYGNFGANGGRAAWARHHRQEASQDSVMSDYSMARLGRPGVGDKMFESAGFALTSIAASPPESVASDQESERRMPSVKASFETKRTSVDSMFDEAERRSSVSSSSESLFGYGDGDEALQGNLFGHGHIRPFSVMSNSISSHGMKEDETMISMLGGGHVRRASLSSLVDASPLGARKRRFHHDDDDAGYEVQPISSPGQVASPARGGSRLAEKASYKFGPERMLKAQAGRLSRESLELSCLSADGEDMTSADISVVLTRPLPASRRPATLVLRPASGSDTPPLSPSTGSSSGSSNGSQSSIDIERLKVVMQQSANNSVSSSLEVPQARLRPRGQGHRRRASQYSQYSRTNSLIETIQEEGASPNSAAGERSFMFPPNVEARDSVHIVDPDDSMEWDEDAWLQTLRRFHQLRTEADEEVETSRKTWHDTPWSVHALQSFKPPAHPTGMKAMLEHSQKTYLPLPFELRSRRVSLRSRASPYGRTYTITVSPKNVHDNSSILQDLSNHVASPPSYANLKPSVMDIASPPPSLSAMNPLSPFHFEFLNKAPTPMPAPAPVAPRQRVPSATRRSALGWSRRKDAATPKEVKSNKENAPPSGVVLMSPTESLRLSRPRPKGRVTSGQTPAARPAGLKA